MQITDLGNGVHLFGRAPMDLPSFPRALAQFKNDTGLRVTAIAPRYEYFRDELLQTGYIVNTEEK